jgi:hypothetical protein
METETDSHITILDIDVYRQSNGSSAHAVHRKPTHTNLHLSAPSHHHPLNKQAVLSAMVHTAMAIFDSNSLPQELKFLHQTFQDNG